MKAIYPRSPREEMDGWVHLPRLIDKIRLNLAGKLHPDYQENLLSKGFDLMWLQAAGISPEQLTEVVRGSVCDAEVCAWVRSHVRVSPDGKEAFRQRVFAHGTEGEELIARLAMRKAQIGAADRDDIRCFVDFIDADEGRL